MQLPSSKVVFATVAALVSAAALVIHESGLPARGDYIGWLLLVAKVLGAAGLVGGAGYQVSEQRPSAELVAAVRSGELPR